MDSIVANNCMINMHKYEQLFGGRLARISALNSEAITVNIKDYNSVSTGVL